MVILRNALKLLLPALIASFMTFSVHASTPATLGDGFKTSYSGGVKSSNAEACNATATYYTTSTGTARTGTVTLNADKNGNQGNCNIQPGNFNLVIIYQAQWICPAGSTLQPDNTCTDPNPCAAKKDQADFGWITRAVGGASPYGSFCSGGCEQYVTGPITNSDNPSGEYYTNGKTRTEYAKWQFSGNSCTAGAAEPVSKDTPSPTTPKKTPPCLASEGVMTSSSGTIACVPEGAPGSAKPIVDKKKTTDAFPDGSQKVTEVTTTRDPTTGVEDKRTTTTTTPASSGTTGQAGAPGTQTSNTTGGQTPSASTGSGKEGDSSSDFCAKNPNMQICKGGMNEEATQKKILKNGEDTLEQIKSITDPGQTPYTAIKDAKQSEESDNKLKDENGKFKDAASGSVDPIASDKSAWQNALSTGWFEPVTRQGCGPVVWGFAGKTVTFDICPPAERLSSWLEYAMWFYICIGIFVALTGGKKGEA